jgi:ADP-heptose:LPS heptosyltransferase
MSLSYILKIDKINPNIVNYINTNEGKVKYWKNELNHLKKYKVGITYNGLLSSVICKNISLSEFKILFDCNIDLICIHKLNEVDEENKAFFKDKITFVDIDNDIPFQDTIAILQNIDLLITIDTFIVHLAGVLNIKTWLLLGYVSDWRWFNDTAICDWYNSVEILRMKENKELKYILTEVKDKLNYV